MRHVLLGLSIAVLLHVMVLFLVRRIPPAPPLEGRPHEQVSEDQAPPSEQVPEPRPAEVSEEGSRIEVRLEEKKQESDPPPLDPSRKELPTGAKEAAPPQAVEEPPTVTASAETDSASGADDVAVPVGEEPPQAPGSDSPLTGQVTRSTDSAAAIPPSVQRAVDGEPPRTPPVDVRPGTGPQMRPAVSDRDGAQIVFASAEAVEARWQRGDIAFIDEARGLIVRPGGSGPLHALEAEARTRLARVGGTSRSSRLVLLGRAFAAELAAFSRQHGGRSLIVMADSISVRPDLRRGIP